MHLVSDSGCDVADEQTCGVPVHKVPLVFTLDDKTYTAGLDIEEDQFFKLLDSTEGMPVTSQPSAGQFAELYRRLAQTDPEILSIHISSGMSGTIQSAKLGASMVPEAHVTIVDSKTLSCMQGWQVEAAARAIQAGWPVARILEVIDRVHQATEGMFTLGNLKYLVHGGRINHMTGLVASLLNIKPIITVEKEIGQYTMIGREITIKRAMVKMVDLAVHWFPQGSALRIQPLHANYLDGVELVKGKLDQLFECHWLPTVQISPILGAHTGSGMVGFVFGDAKMMVDIHR